MSSFWFPTARLYCHLPRWAISLACLWSVSPTSLLSQLSFVWLDDLLASTPPAGSCCPQIKLLSLQLKLCSLALIHLLFSPHSLPHSSCGQHLTSLNPTVFWTRFMLVPTLCLCLQCPASVLPKLPPSSPVTPLLTSHHQSPAPGLFIVFLCYRSCITVNWLYASHGPLNSWVSGREGSFLTQPSFNEIISP